MLSDAQVTQYHADGFVIPDFRLPPATVADIRADRTVDGTERLSNWMSSGSFRLFRGPHPSGHTTTLPMPTWIMRAGATLFDWLPFFPVTRDQLTMLEEGNTADPEILRKLTGREPKAFTAENLDYLNG